MERFGWCIPILAKFSRDSRLGEIEFISSYSCYISVANAKRIGSFRGVVTALPSAVEACGEAVLINECWLEQEHYQDFISTPWRNRSTFTLCVNLRKRVDLWAWAFRTPEPIMLLGCTHYGPANYHFRLDERDLVANQMVVAFDAAEEPFGVPDSRQLVTFTWDAPRLIEDKFGFYEYCLYWPFAILVYLFVLIPVLLLSGVLPIEENEITLAILAWLYRGSRPWKKY